PAVYIVWIVLSCLTVPMYVLAPKELAPPEDQSIVFGIVEAPADATIDQTTFYAEAENKELMAVPERAQTFQITSPDQSFRGLVLKPGDQRKRSAFDVVPVVQNKVNGIPGIRSFIGTPPSLPGGGQFNVEVVIGSTAEPEVILKLAEDLQMKAAKSGKFA